MKIFPGKGIVFSNNCLVRQY